MPPSWSFPNAWLPLSLQKRLVRFLLKRAIGQFLAKDNINMNLDSLDLHWSSGKVSLQNLDLDRDALNDLVADLPLVITSGRIAKITVTIPWKDLWAGNCCLELEGLEIHATVKTSLDDEERYGLSKSSMSDSHIMSSSMHFAENFLRTQASDDDDDSDPDSDVNPASADPSLPASPVSPQESTLEGLQSLARVIDKIMGQVRVSAKDSLLRLHHPSPDRTFTHILDISLPLAVYRDDTEAQQRDGAGAESARSPDPAIPDILKLITLSGLTISLSQIPIPAIPSSDEEDDPSTAHLSPSPLPPTTIFASSPAEDDVWIRVSGLRRAVPSGADTARQWSAEAFVRSLCILVSPASLKPLSDIMKAFEMAASEGPASPGMPPRRRSDVGDQHGLAAESVLDDLAESGAYRRALGADIYDSDSDADPDRTNPRFKSDEANSAAAPPLRLSLRVLECTAYILHSDPQTHLDPDAFFASFFTGNGSGAYLDVDPTRANTLMNARRGSPIVVEAIAASIGVDHLRFAIEGVSAKASAGLIEIEVEGVEAGEWLAPRESYASPHVLSTPTPFRTPKYSPILTFTTQPDIPTNIYAPIRLDPAPIPRPTSIPQPSRHAARGVPKGPVVRCRIQTTPAERRVDIGAGGVEFFVDLRMIGRTQGISRALRGDDVGDWAEKEVEGVNRWGMLHFACGAGWNGVEGAWDLEQRSDQRTGSFSLGDHVGFIMNDLDERDLHFNRPTLSTKLRIESPLIRVWIKVPDMSLINDPEGWAAANRESRIRPTQLLIDLINPAVSTTSGDDERPRSRRESGAGAGGGTGVGGGTSFTEGEPVRWCFEVADLGVCLAEAVGKEMHLTPIFLLTSLNSTSPRPNAELTLRSPSRTHLAAPPLAAVISTPTGLRFARPPASGSPHSTPFSDDDEDDDNVPSMDNHAATDFEPRSNNWGFQSWYDVGGRAAPAKGSEGKGGEEDDDAVWFRQRTVRESLVFLNCQLPSCHLSLSKSTLDTVQILLNDLSLFQPLAPTTPFTPSMPDTAPALMLFGEVPSSTNDNPDDPDADGEESRYFEAEGPTWEGKFDGENIDQSRGRAPLGVDTAVKGGDQGSVTAMTGLVNIGVCEYFLGGKICAVAGGGRRGREDIFRSWNADI
ncbi:hypothetical protein BDK51DRAFT_48267 [Blyttiomyces helicus]|uniref:Autophagy-related protein 2 n=1 Tax=Blyttiomyces helicus TaxID=388810 RepID=A0A4P9WD32_9FUNG|nr:hypothetical protein BDK51DRAFT_48267 [Blyttiomyces helicus]|eukprot:RKO90581.1 hypothetical protein BDK51DRAFT_48267 [Blyttiomyces helicus]